MARTKIDVPVEKQCGYTSVIVSYSTGIDSTGALYWATQNFAPEKIFLLYCDTGAEYSVNDAIFFRTAKILGLKPVMLKPEKDFMFPDKTARCYKKCDGPDIEWSDEERRMMKKAGAYSMFMDKNRPPRALLGEMEEED